MSLQRALQRSSETIVAAATDSHHRRAVCRRTFVGGSWIIFVIANITELAANRNDEFRDFTGSI
jgi:hypothetical protein